MKKTSLALLMTASSLYAKAATPPPEVVAWMTGPLLCPSYSTVPAGSYNIEPYLFVSSTYGNYNSSWNTVKQPNFMQTVYYFFTQIGLTNYFNISLSPQFIYQSQSNNTSANIGDLPLQAYFTILNEKLNGATPGIILGIRAKAPIARYQKLNPDYPNVQAIGNGSWEPALNFVIGKQIHFKDIHFLTVRSYFNVKFKNKVSVHGFNAYGGGYGTKGKVTLGTQYTAIGSIEYSFSRHGVFALDLEWLHTNKITFKGTPGSTTLNGSTPADNTSPSADQINLAPAFEYNFNANVGIIGGVWFSIAGRNEEAFVSPTFALNIEY